MNAPADAADALRAFGLTYPEAHLKSPWPDVIDDPMPMFRAWIDESYRAQAPNRLSALAPAP
jgi:hypothetical protein